MFDSFQENRFQFQFQGKPGERDRETKEVRLERNLCVETERGERKTIQQDRLKFEF